MDDVYFKKLKHDSVEGNLPRVFFCTERQLLRMVRSVSEDRLNDTIEFNKFLQMMSKQQKEEVEKNDLVDYLLYREHCFY